MALPAPVHVMNDGLAFLLELTALAALARWGWQSANTQPARLALAVGAPLAAAVLWGLFAAPKAQIPVPLAGVLAVQALVYGAAVAALYALGRHGWAALFATVIVLNTLLAAVDHSL